MKPAKLPPRLNRTPYPRTPEPADVRYRNRQLTLGDIGAVQHVNPPLPPAIRAALQTSSGANYCVEAWCDRPPTTAGRCSEHAAEAAADVHAAIARIRRTPRKSRKVQL
jgi:hypothetical protein